MNIRPMTRIEIDMAIEWAAAEGWNPGWRDADCFYEADPQGFLLGLLGDEPVATISAVRYGATFGFIGFYMVKPEYRGQGYGIQLWRAALEHLRGRQVGLDGVVAQQANYQRSGFVMAHRNIRYQGLAGGIAPHDFNVVQLSGLPIQELCAYDQPFFPGPREAFLRAWIAQPGGVALGWLDSGKLAGYGVMRRCRNGYKVGPLLADDARGAEALLLALKARASEPAPFFLDVPEVNEAAMALVERLHLSVVFETARMYLGPAPELPFARWFGVTSFELG